MAEETERYRAKVSFQHKFVNVSKQLDKPNFFQISSPSFVARNIPFQLELLKDDNGEICCDLDCLEEGDEEYSFNAEFQFSLIRSASTTKSAEFSNVFTAKNCYHRTILSEMFPDERIFLDDAIKLEVSLWVDEPEKVSEYKPPKEKLRQGLQIQENHVQSDAFLTLLESGDFLDVTFVTKMDPSRVKAHKTILAARSDVFARMLTTDMKEAKDKEIRIDDMGATSLKIMLRHIYTGQLEFSKGIKVDLKICQELANAGEKYGLQNLKEYAAMAMTEFVSLENMWELLSFVERLKAGAATQTLASYYAENVHKIIKKASF